MIQMQTKLTVQDNSGAKKVQCIKTFQGSIAYLGDILLVSIKDMQTNLKKKTKIKKGMVIHALLTQTTFFSKTVLGYLKFDKNQVILLDKKKQPYGNRILGPVTQELRKRKLNKIVLLASYVL